MTASADIGRRAARGRAFVLAGRLVQTGLTFASFVVLARILDPADFGVCAMVLVPAELAKSLVELGLPVAVVQRDDWTEEELSAVFWRHLPRIVAVTVALFAASPLLGVYFEQDGLPGLMTPLGAGIVVTGLAVVPTGLLRRRLQFGRAVGIAVLATAVAFGAAVLLARAGAGAWSLVVQVGLTWALEGVGNVVAARWWPRLARGAADVREAVRFGTGFTAAKIVRQAATQLDRWVVGGLVSPSVFGFYQQAFRWAWTPQERILAALLNVDVSAFSRLRQDPEALRRQVRSAFALPYLLLVPGALFGVAFAPRLVVALFGETWAPAATPFRWLLVAGGLLLPAQLGQAIFLARGRAAAWLRWSVVETAVLGVAVVGAAAVDVTWVAPSVAVARGLLLGPAVFAATAGGPLRPQDVLGPALWPLAGALLALAGTLALEASIGALWWPYAALVFGGLFGLAQLPGPFGARRWTRSKAESPVV